MMKPSMSFDKAREIATAVTKERKRYGAQYSSQYSKSTLEEALDVLNAGIEDIHKAGRDELTRANRQYAALNARYEKLKNKTES